MRALDVSDMMSEGRESIMSSADYGPAGIRRTLFTYISTVLLLLVLGTRYDSLATPHNFAPHY